MALKKGKKRSLSESEQVVKKEVTNNVTNVKKDKKQKTDKKPSPAQNGQAPLKKSKPEPTNEGQKKQLSSDELKAKIKEIESRPELTKSARKKLATFNKLLKLSEGASTTETPKVSTNDKNVEKDNKKVEKKNKKRSLSASSVDDNKSKGKVQHIETSGQSTDKNKVKDNKKEVVSKKSAKIEVQKPNIAKVNKPVQKQEKKSTKGGNFVKIQKKQIVEEDDDDDDDDDDEIDSDVDDEEIEEESEEGDSVEINNETGENETSMQLGSDDEDDDDDEEDMVEDESEEEAETTVEAAEDSDDEDDDDDEEEEEDDEEEDEEKPKKKGKADTEAKEPKKNRYILFLGNIPYSATKETITSHFKTKVSEIVDVRIPLNPFTKAPRGFAYLELPNQLNYEKALSLHHSFMNDRRINVLYTARGSDPNKNAKIVSKNKKFDALRKAGVFAGSKPTKKTQNTTQSKA